MHGVIHHVEIYGKYLERTKLFWTWLLTEKFSYQIFQNWPSGISYKYKESYIVFVQTEDKYLSTSYNRKNIGLNHLAFHAENRAFVDELSEELKVKNIPILYEDKHPYAGGENYYAVFFEDPDRIKVEVVSME